VTPPAPGGWPLAHGVEGVAEGPPSEQGPSHRFAQRRDGILFYVDLTHPGDGLVHTVAAGRAKNEGSCGGAARVGTTGFQLDGIPEGATDNACPACVSANLVALAAAARWLGDRAGDQGGSADAP
jgi:hypothetical protein